MEQKGRGGVKVGVEKNEAFDAALSALSAQLSLVADVCGYVLRQLGAVTRDIFRAMFTEDQTWPTRAERKRTGRVIKSSRVKADRRKWRLRIRRVLPRRRRKADNEETQEDEEKTE